MHISVSFHLPPLPQSYFLPQVIQNSSWCNWIASFRVEVVCVCPQCSEYSECGAACNQQKRLWLLLIHAIEFGMVWQDSLRAKSFSIILRFPWRQFKTEFQFGKVLGTTKTSLFHFPAFFGRFSGVHYILYCTASLRNKHS